jgi:uncharacterized protein YycO
MMQNIKKQTNIFKSIAFTALILTTVSANTVTAISRSQAENAVRDAYRTCLGRSPEDLNIM